MKAWFYSRNFACFMYLEVEPLNFDNSRIQKEAVEWLSESIRCHNDESICRFWATMYADPGMLYLLYSVPCSQPSKSVPDPGWDDRSALREQYQDADADVWSISSKCPVSCIHIFIWIVNIFSVQEYWWAAHDRVQEVARAQSCGTDSGAKKRSHSEDNVAAMRNSDDDTRKILRDCPEYLLGASFKTPGSVSVVSEGSWPGARGRNRPRPSNLSSPYFTQGMMALCDALWSLNNIKYVW